jgi:hypothetical protein
VVEKVHALTDRSGTWQETTTLVSKVNRTLRGCVPLFVEELTRLLLERGERGGVQAIPPTLQQSLAARLDRLGTAREVAQVGAVLGRDFVYALLCDVAELDEPSLQASLDRLADADLLFVEGSKLRRLFFPGTVLDKSAVDHIRTTMGGYRYATAVGSDITGFGADEIIIDDPVQPEDALSERVKQQLRDWVNSSVYTRFNDPSKGALVLVACYAPRR